MFPAIGLVIVLAAVFGSFVLAGGNFSIIAHALPHELMAIGGAAVGAFIVANKTHVLKGAGKGLAHALKGAKWTRDDYRDLLVLLFLLATRLRTNAMSLEPHIEKPSESDIFTRFPRLLADHHLTDFLCDYIRMMGIEKIAGHQLAEAMDADLERRHHESLEPQHALQTMADGLPAIGIVAAVLGVIKTMGSIDQPTNILGGMIGGALVGTFLGVLLSYCVVGPLAARLKQAIDDEHRPLEIARSVLLLAFQDAAAPVAVEIGRRQTPEALAPTFAEVDEACQAVKALASGKPQLKAA